MRCEARRATCRKRARECRSGDSGRTPSRRACLRTMETLEVPESAFDPDYAPTKGRWSKRAKRSERWVKPTAVAEVSFVEWTPGGSLRHPTFHGMRQDKAARFIRRESAVVVRTPKRTPARAVKVSNPDRIIDPSTGFKRPSSSTITRASQSECFPICATVLRLSCAGVSHSPTTAPRATDNRTGGLPIRRRHRRTYSH